MFYSCSSLYVLGLVLTRGHAAAQTSTATWQFPLLENVPTDGLTINYIDTVVLQWTSNYQEAWLKFWCQNGTTGNNVTLGSQFQVLPSGNFPYIMLSEDSNQAVFPVACHAELAPHSGQAGVDSPVGVTFTSQLDVKARTFSVNATSSSSSSVTTAASSAVSAVTSPSSSGSIGPLISPTVPAVSITPIPSAPIAYEAAGGNTGIKIGVGIGAAILIVAILIGASIWMFVRRRKRAVPCLEGKPLPKKPSPVNLRYGKFELEDETNRRHELAGHPAACEVEEDSRRFYELA